MVVPLTHFSRKEFSKGQGLGLGRVASPLMIEDSCATVEHAA